MNILSTTLNESLNRLKVHFKENDPAFKINGGDPPMRSELFNADQMEQHGKWLASAHAAGSAIIYDKPLLSRLSENEEVLIEVHNLIMDSVKANRQITPAGEWLLDNFYLIEDHIRTAKIHLPKQYNVELPRLPNSTSDAPPRVYDIAKEIISHGDGRVDHEGLTRFIRAYQSVTTLKIGELWAIPIMLRFALIENLRRVAYRVALGRIDRNLADYWADQMIETVENNPQNLIILTADMARSEPPMTAPFVSEFARRLQGQSSALSLPITWIEQRLSQSNNNISQLILSGNQQLAADQVSISNSIASLRFLGSIDWKDFVENLSAIDRILTEDPAGAYDRMDFTTRDQYRHIIEKISRNSRFTEVEVAQAAIDFASKARQQKGNRDRTSHVGYYIVDKGVRELEAIAGLSIDFRSRLKRICLRHPLMYYVGSILLLTGLFSGFLIEEILKAALPVWFDWVSGLILVLSISYLAVLLVNWITTLFALPGPLPRLDFSEGVPAEARTLVVVPCMLVSNEQTDNLVDDLEVRYLANRDRNILFGLLTDFMDAPAETLPGDEELLNYMNEKIHDLNEKYRDQKTGTFFLFHRPRKWNATEKIWMGYERKRGKLADLNLLIKGSGTERFSLVSGNIRNLNIKYVITLDVDTQLPRDSARQLIATMSHPLNKPFFDVSKGRITSGYTILQPRVAVGLTGSNQSRYARLFGTEPGIDPYTRTISDVYQDLFNEGSFVGKGIYDVDSFETLMGDRLPENRILSHDLIEGCITRSGLSSDILLFENYPSNYLADVSRRHRWIRGDWQLLPWLLPWVPDISGKFRKNYLSRLSLWKLFDNLRRSLVPPAILLVLAADWLLLSSPWFWTLAVLGIVFIPTMVITLIDVFNKPKDVAFRQHLIGSRQVLYRHLSQDLYMLMCIPFEAYYSLDAILRTLWRLLVTKKRLLEWNASANGTNPVKNRMLNLFKKMWFSPFYAISILLSLVYLNPGGLVYAWPFILLWVASPIIVWWIDTPLPEHVVNITVAQGRFLFDLARKTWSFFENFVTSKDNWLPPDNYQEHPRAVIAHRTSPTNIGLSLLSNFAAYDFGYIHTGELLERLGNSYQSMEKLERYHGHFFNWYDTETLRPLFPLYISSVDSGNLAGHLLTIRAGLYELYDQPIIGPRLFDGINDTLNVLTNSSSEYFPDKLLNFKRNLEAIQSESGKSLKEIWKGINILSESSRELLSLLSSSNDTQLVEWASALDRQCHSALNELIHLVPWIAHPLVLESSINIPGSESTPTLRQLGSLVNDVLNIHGSLFKLQHQDLFRLIELSNSRGSQRLARIEELILQTNGFLTLKYDFLYDKSRHLQAIGFNVDDRRPDAGYYDLLASEARLSSFVGIALGQLPQESWFAMSRMLTGSNGTPVLLSWSGSMFEYLMPHLIMPVYQNTLLKQACYGAVSKQIEYGKQRGIPWGISESGYYFFDQYLNYQYRAFGVPDLGLKRGLSEDLVVAPYASALALITHPEEACRNLEKMAAEGFLGRYGFYEAIDYTPSRIPRGQSYVIVKSYMSHHTGMTFLALAHTLLEKPMHRRFEADPLLQASLVLLHERIPRYTTFFSDAIRTGKLNLVTAVQETPIRIFNTPNTQYPQVHLLSNGKYQVAISNAGGGFSKWNDLAVTRWREDTTRDNWGSFCYIRDFESGYFWSVAYQPTLKKPDKYEAIFSEGRAEFRRRDKDIDSHTEIVVSPEDDIELRRVHLKNRSRENRIIDITSYAEVVILSPIADATHPAFNNLFVQTEIYYQRQALLCTRRPRSVNDQTPWMFHLMTVHGAEIRNITYETDRMKFIGRGNTTESPDAMTMRRSLSNTQGPVLDPVVAIQYQVIIEPDSIVTVDIVTGMCDTRNAAIALIEKYHDHQLANRVFELAWTHSQVVLQQINAVESDAQLYGRLAGSVIYSNPAVRSEPDIIARNRRGQSGLWGYSISGDLPIVLVQIEDPNNINLIRQLVQAHGYWRLKGLMVDMVIWIEDHAGYRQSLQDQIMGLIAAGIEANIVGRPGGIFVRQGDQISIDDRILFQAVARAVISDKNGTLAEQLNRRSINESQVARFEPVRYHRPETPKDMNAPDRDLSFYNGTGGFTRDGREYIIYTSGINITPAPWVNVIANAGFGTVVSENGQSYSWSENAHEFRLSPWNNDPVSDYGGEAIYIRDEETGYFWSPLPFMKTGPTHYITRHGFGYTVFEHEENGIFTELTIYVSVDAPVKFYNLKIRNTSGKLRKLSVTGFIEWVLGDHRQKTAMHIVSEADINSSAIFARNPYNSEFGDRVAFYQVNNFSACSFTCDRNEFIGRNGSMRNPVAMKRVRLSGKRGASLDPCVALQIPAELNDRQEYNVVFSLGSGHNMEEANALAIKYRGLQIAQNELGKVWEHWNRTLGAVHVETPDASLNFLANGWLIYQTLASRIWARSGYYQSGGAFGFRDQLQDAMALIYTAPHLLREQILLHAGRQFVEGDVQHWWHPPTGRGVRTHCSDDYLWLPLATCRYIKATGDKAILDELIHFLEGRPLDAEEESYYDLPNQSRERASLYKHCVRALEYGMRYGEHGLPFIGSHDWNDGMNKVGDKGKGESVWLGFFLYDVFNQFATVAREYGDSPFAEKILNEATFLRENLEDHGWDGEWYLRAYFDDGTPLGSSKNSECSIDSISQSWAVLSGAGDHERTVRAMDSVNRKLVRRDMKLVQLLDPPFDKSNLNPGYIKGYIPGVRENGGQYTHAAIWTAMAFARLGDKKNAWEVLSLINPINHATTPDEVDIYRVEPYVIAADVYSRPPHAGRGGWTWYTGSASWIYRLIIESLLGLRLEGNILHIKPCIPDSWQSFKVDYTLGQSNYHIQIIQKDHPYPNGGIMTDGNFGNQMMIQLNRDRGEHHVEVFLPIANIL